jgi:hypothetical protein
MKIKRFNENIYDDLMSTRFQDKTKDKGFYVPSPAGPEGKIPQAGTNAGGDNRVKTFKEFFGEYRKGSEKFGKIVSRIMEFLRLPEFKKHIEENDGIKFEIADFENRSHIKVDKIKQLLNTDHNLYSFDINIDDKYITFSNINKTYKNRYVSGRLDG